MFNITKKSIDVAGKTMSMETGRMAKQANGSVLITYGDTCILVTATMQKKVKEGMDFFPLTVDVAEKMYASGKIPGGFIKREAKPSTKATLTARLIDRSIRPLFPDGFRNEIQVVVTILAYDGSCDIGCLGIVGASAALTISDIPFNGPIAGCAVGFENDEYIIFPSDEQLETSLLDLSVAGSETSVVMIESFANELNEEQMVNAVYEGHEVIKQLVQYQKDFAKDIAKEKYEYEPYIIPEEIVNSMTDGYAVKIDETAHILGKLERQEAFEALKEEVLEKYAEEMTEEEFEENERHIKNAFEALIKKKVRHAILYDNHRADGRTMDEIRPITCELDILPRVHGSALFTRGETQSLGVITLGTTSDEKIIDGLSEEYRKRFYLHYNFPSFSVGEVGWMRPPGRRELGHGMLAERSITPMIPAKEDFPYTIRAVSEILESNGSSSMATVCSTTLALMGAGVPIKRPVAGIANGLIMEGDDYVVLTDIMGLEDHLGDMDFKVAGTTTGITAMQMDIKIEGITKEIMKIALAKALTARLFILGKITAEIEAPRDDIAASAPRIESFKIDQSRIGELIGPSGKVIKGIIEKTGVDINIDDDGTVSVAAVDKSAIDLCKKYVGYILDGPVLNEIYEGVVTRIESFGAFVKFLEGYAEGMVHISNLDSVRINEVTDVVKLGDTVKVKFIKMERGKIALSMKDIEGNPKVDRETYVSKPFQRSNDSRDSRDSRDNRDRRDHRRSHGDSRGSGSSRKPYNKRNDNSDRRNK